MPMNEALRETWVQAGYPRTIGSAAVVPPPAPDFLRLYHLTSAAHAISDIAFGRLKVARISELNDPFELLSLSMRNKRVRNYWEAIRNQFNETRGLLCFSKDWTSPALWSHYGDRHKGICLGFNVPRGIVSEVKYTASRIKFRPPDDSSKISIGPAKAESLIFLKYEHWKYEAEVRRVVELSEMIEEGPLHFCPFENGLDLAEVVLGPECGLTVASVRNLVGSLHPNAVTYKARLASGHYSVVPAEKTVP